MNMQIIMGIDTQGT